MLHTPFLHTPLPRERCTLVNFGCVHHHIIHSRIQCNNHSDIFTRYDMISKNGCCTIHSQNRSNSTLQISASQISIARRGWVHRDMSSSRRNVSTSAWVIFQRGLRFWPCLCILAKVTGKRTLLHIRILNWVGSWLIYLTTEVFLSLVSFSGLSLRASLCWLKPISTHRNHSSVYPWPCT